MMLFQTYQREERRLPVCNASTLQSPLLPDSHCWAASFCPKPEEIPKFSMWASDTCSWAWSLSQSHPWTKHLEKWVWQQTGRILTNPNDIELESNWMTLKAMSVGRNQWEFCHKQPSSGNLNSRWTAFFSNPTPDSNSWDPNSLRGI